MAFCNNKHVVSTRWGRIPACIDVAFRPCRGARDRTTRKFLASCEEYSFILRGKRKWKIVFKKNVSKLSTISLFTSGLRVFLQRAVTGTGIKCSTLVSQKMYNLNHWLPLNAFFQNIRSSGQSLWCKFRVWTKTERTLPTASSMFIKC